MENLTPIKAIRAKCLDCSGSQPSEVRKCESFGCSLFPYRMGKNPNRGGIGRKFSYIGKKVITEIAVSDEKDAGSVYRWVSCDDQKNLVEKGENGQA